MSRRILAMTVTTCMLAILVATVSLPSTASPVQADNLLKDVTRLDGYNIYFGESSGEASRFDRTDTGISRFAGLLELLGANLLTLEWRNGISPDADMVIIAGLGRNQFSDEQTAWLWAYLQNGGRVLFLVDPDGLNNVGLQGNRGFFKLLWDDMGLRGQDDIVMRDSGETMVVFPPADRVRAGTPTPTPLPAVEMPFLITDFTTSNINFNHPITAGLGEYGLAFHGARSLEVDEAPRPSQVTALVYTDADFYGESDFADYYNHGVSEYNINDDTTYANHALVAAMQDGNTGARFVLIGDREFALNGFGLQTSPAYSASFVYPGNVYLLLNSVAWLLGADATNTFDLPFPTPDATATATLTPSVTPTLTPTPSTADATPTAGE